jgi:hypothetical protein
MRAGMGCGAGRAVHTSDCRRGHPCLATAIGANSAGRDGSPSPTCGSVFPGLPTTVLASPSTLVATRLNAKMLGDGFRNVGAQLSWFERYLNTVALWALRAIRVLGSNRLSRKCRPSRYRPVAQLVRALP